MLARVLVALVLLAGSVFGQEITLTATPRADLGEWVQIHVETTAKGRLLRVWRIKSGADELVGKGLLELAGGDWALVSTPGSYRIEALAVGANDSIVTAEALSTIGPAVVVPDNPPVVVVPPVVTPGKRWIVILRETSDSDPATAQLLSLIRKTIDPYAVQKGHRLMILDKDAVPNLAVASPSLKPWLDKALPAPSILIGDPSVPNAPLVVEPLPSSADAVMSLLKKYGG